MTPTGVEGGEMMGPRVDRERTRRVNTPVLDLTESEARAERDRTLYLVP